ncbi:MAG: DUF5666 domain-containing protein [Candidatus Woesebacteria bacterium]
MQKNNLIIVTVVLVILAGAGGFAGGMKYQQSKRSTFVTTGGAFGGRPGFGTGAPGQTRGGTGRGAGFRPVAGEIIAADDTSITVKLQDGSSKIVMLSDKTTINKADTATKTDLKVGTQVAVFGQDNSDGSVTAQSVQLNPMMRFGGTPNETPSASATPSAK